MARICNGCLRITETVRGYCADCRPAQHRARNSRPLHKIHNSAAWRNARRRVLERDGGQCVRCGGEANTVHVTNYDDPYNVDNLESLCASCHGQVDGARSQQPSRAGRRATT